VARVTRIEREVGQTFAQVLAAPLAALGRGREVLLLKIAESPAAAEEGIAPSATGETPALPPQAASGSDEEGTLPANENAEEVRDE
jgi:hypothetical protein